MKGRNTSSCTNTRVPLVHTWPALSQFPAIAALTAPAKFASGNTRIGDLPPASTETLLSVEEATFITCLPVSTDPVTDTCQAKS